MQEYEKKATSSAGAQVMTAKMQRKETYHATRPYRNETDIVQDQPSSLQPEAQAFSFFRPQILLARERVLGSFSFSLSFSLLSLDSEEFFFVLSFSGEASESVYLLL